MHPYLFNIAIYSIWLIPTAIVAWWQERKLTRGSGKTIKPLSYLYSSYTLALFAGIMLVTGTIPPIDLHIEWQRLAVQTYAFVIFTAVCAGIFFSAICLSIVARNTRTTNYTSWFIRGALTIFLMAPTITAIFSIKDTTTIIYAFRSAQVAFLLMILTTTMPTFLRAIYSYLTKGEQLKHQHELKIILTCFALQLCFELTMPLVAHGLHIYALHVPKEVALFGSILAAICDVTVLRSFCTIACEEQKNG